MRVTDAAILLLILVLAGYVLLAAAITLGQRHIVYKPDPRRTTPEVSGLPGVRVETIATSDGHTLVAWYVPAAAGRRTVVYFHGNAGWIELRAERLAALASQGFGVLMPSYRGYGGSTGVPSEAANVADAKRVFDWVRDQGVGAHDIVVFGESLGTGVATQLAAAKICAGLVLDSPYTSMTELGRRKYPWLPVAHLIRDRYETIRHIKRVTVPVLVMHGEADALVPVEMGRAVASAVPGARKLVTFPGAPHLEHLRAGSFEIAARFIDGLAGGEARALENEKPGTSPGFERPNPFG